jgi:preprotein translocase subunit SecA
MACQKYNISAPCASKILQAKDEILELAKSGVNTNMKAKHVGRNSLVEQILFDWYKNQTKAGVNVTGPMLKSKAEELSSASEVSCSFSTGWLDGFKRRYQIQFKSSQKESRQETKNNGLLEQILAQWVKHQQACNVIVTGPALKAKAEELAKVCASTSEGFKFSTIWLDSFKKRHGIRFRSASEQITTFENSPVSKTEPGPSSLPPPPPHLMEELMDVKPPPNLHYYPYK